MLVRSCVNTLKQGSKTNKTITFDVKHVSIDHDHHVERVIGSHVLLIMKIIKRKFYDFFVSKSMQRDLLVGKI